MRVICMSDTHGLHRNTKVPDGDVLVFAGDITSRGASYELVDFNEWLGELPHSHKIVVAGNHDWCFQNDHVLSEKILGIDKEKSVVIFMSSGNFSGINIKSLINNI